MKPKKEREAKVRRHNKKLRSEHEAPRRVKKMFYVDPDVGERADGRAAELGKSFSAYVNDLVEADLARED